MDEIITKFPQVFEGMSDRGIEIFYDAAIDMAYEKLKTERQDPKPN